MRERSHINKSVYINSSNVNKVKPVNNDNNNSNEAGNSQKINEEKKKEEKSYIQPKFGNIMDRINKFSNKNITATNNEPEKNIKPPESIHQKSNSLTTDDSKNNQANTNKIENKNEKIDNINTNKEINKDNEYKQKLKEKVSLLNKYAEKNKNKDNGTKDFYNRRKTFFTNDVFKDVNNLYKEEISSKEYKQSFDKLHNLQNLLKKESSLRELCKYIILFIFNNIFYSYKDKRRNKEEY
jgi:hypothetical protein